jgi:putative radical SAM enzyme (TIGR03279 family)
MSYPSVLEVVAGSPAAAAGLAVGDELVEVNGVRPSDVIEYQVLVDEADPELTILRGGVERTVAVAKSHGVPVGLRLSSSIFDRVQTCDNHCSFCFIYQLPAGMRRSLYLKDDDYRLSFLYGNFTTLTRFTELDLDRIRSEGLGPLYVSIHAADPEVRAGMLRNRRGATSLRWLRALLDAGVTVHGQVVLCPGINNGEVLERTCAEILAAYPELASVGIVPLGLSKFNTEAGLIAHDRDEAGSDLDIIEAWQEIARRRLGRRLFFASDEMYLTADRPFPEVDAYEDFSQHENGIGMAQAFYTEIETLEGGNDPALRLPTGEWRSLPAAIGAGYRAPRGGGASGRPGAGPVVIATGEYGARVLTPVLRRLEALAGTELRLLAVRNEFFGGNVAVSGLVVGEDLQRALAADCGPATRYLVPDVALSGDRFLDEMTIAEVAAVAAAEVRVVETTAAGLVAGAVA